MMGDEKVEKIKEILWRDCQDDPDTQVYMILDAARDKKIFIGLMNSDEEYVCLYKGEKSKELETCAPYLVRLEKEGKFTSWILEQGWGNSWGIYLQTKLNIQKVRDHFREFVMVVDDEGLPAYFRFYDPRVLRFFLLNFDSEQLSDFFSYIDQYILENENSGGMITYHKMDSGDVLEKKWVL